MLSEDETLDFGPRAMWGRRPLGEGARWENRSKGSSDWTFDRRGSLGRNLFMSQYGSIHPSPKARAEQSPKNIFFRIDCYVLPAMSKRESTLDGSVIEGHSQTGNLGLSHNLFPRLLILRCPQHATDDLTLQLAHHHDQLF